MPLKMKKNLDASLAQKGEIEVVKNIEDVLVKDQQTMICEQNLTLDIQDQALPYEDYFLPAAQVLPKIKVN